MVARVRWLSREVARLECALETNTRELVAALALIILSFLLSRLVGQRRVYRSSSLPEAA